MPIAIALFKVNPWEQTFQSVIEFFTTCLFPLFWLRQNAEIKIHNLNLFGTCDKG